MTVHHPRLATCQKKLAEHFYQEGMVQESSTSCTKPCRKVSTTKSRSWFSQSKLAAAKISNISSFLKKNPKIPSRIFHRPRKHTTFIRKKKEQQETIGKIAKIMLLAKIQAPKPRQSIQIFTSLYKTLDSTRHQTGQGNTQFNRNATAKFH